VCVHVCVCVCFPASRNFRLRYYSQLMPTPSGELLLASFQGGASNGLTACEVFRLDANRNNTWTMLFSMTSKWASASMAASDDGTITFLVAGTQAGAGIQK